MLRHEASAPTKLLKGKKEKEKTLRCLSVTQGKYNQRNLLCHAEARSICTDKALKGKKEKEKTLRCLSVTQGKYNQRNLLCHADFKRHLYRQSTQRKKREEKDASEPQRDIY